MTTSTRRSRKKETRDKLLRTAYEVFVEVGYEQATLAEIVGRSDLHIQTLVRHFPTKGELMAAIHVASQERFEKYLLNRTGDALRTWRDWVELNASQAPDILSFPDDGYRFPVITAAGQEAVHRTKELLADAIAEDIDVSRATDLRPTLIACTLIAGNAHVAQSWAGKRLKKEQFVASLLDVVDVTKKMLVNEFPNRKVA